MIIDQTDGKLEEIEAFISENPQFKESFDRCMDSLKRIDENNPEYSCLLMKDWAPHSLSFVFRNRRNHSDTLLHGGLIFHGNPDESLSVQLEPSIGFQIHT